MLTDSRTNQTRAEDTGAPQRPPLRYGIVGAGMIAQVHARAIAAIPNAQLTAVHDRVPERADAFAREHGVAAETDLDAFLHREDVDAVTVTTPSGVRADVAVPAARAGKHVLCEKPLEVTLERSERIIHACSQSGVVLGCLLPSRTGRNVERIRQAICSGRLGRLVMADVQVPWFRTQEYYDSAAWRGTWKLDGGGALMNQSIHSVDLLLHFMGQPTLVYAMTDQLTHKAIEVEDTAVALVRFAGGAMATIAATTTCAPGFCRRIEICGERGSVVLEDDRLTRWRFTDSLPEDADIARTGAQGEQMHGGAGDPAAITHEGHRRQIADFTQAVLDGRSPLVSGAEGLRAVELICAIYDSARSGAPVKFQR